MLEKEESIAGSIKGNRRKHARSLIGLCIMKFPQAQSGHLLSVQMFNTTLKEISIKKIRLLAWQKSIKTFLKKRNKQKQKQTKLETQQVVRCKIRFLVGYENERTFATITTTKKRSRLSILVPRKELSCQRIQTHQG